MVFPYPATPEARWLIGGPATPTRGSPNAAAKRPVEPRLILTVGVEEEAKLSVGEAAAICSTAAAPRLRSRRIISASGKHADAASVEPPVELLPAMIVRMIAGSSWSADRQTIE
jgi:hypothetical protein